jgi:hypothetical protein
MLRIAPLCLLLAALVLPGVARGVPFVNALPVDRFELSGGATFVDEFHNSDYPASDYPGVPWIEFCGSASESGGALWIESTGPGPDCGGGDDWFVSGPNTSFLNNTVLTADFLLPPAPAEGESVGILMGTRDAGDLIQFGIGSFDEKKWIWVADETRWGAVEIPSANFATNSFSLRISLVLNTATNILVPTLYARRDTDPFQELNLIDPASWGLNRNELEPFEAYGGAIVGYVPEPSTAVLLGFGLLSVLALRRRLSA